MNVRIESPRRAPLTDTKFSRSYGDENVWVGWEYAMAWARQRAAERGCRQQVRKARTTRPLQDFDCWFIQDVR